MECFNNTISNINYSIFEKWLMYYYHAWSGKESKCIIQEFDDFRLGNFHLILIHTHNLMMMFGNIGAMLDFLQVK